MSRSIICTFVHPNLPTSGRATLTDSVTQSYPLMGNATTHHTGVFRPTLIALLVAAVLLLAGFNPSSQATTAAVTRIANEQQVNHLPLLHASRGAHPDIYDSADRQVILRAVNYNALGDYYQDDPNVPTVFPASAQDMAEMASLGLNGIRLVLSWSALEPRRGHFSTGYINRIRTQIERARAHGLYVVLDMHQDAWGKRIATRGTGDICIPPLEPAIGWDGAPAWATFTDGLTTCRLAKREFSPAVLQAFNNFWFNRDGIQTQFINAWQHLVRAFAGYRNVAGYDLFNEPNPGYLFLVGNITLQANFYRRLIAAIRTTEQTTPGALEHIVFFEPSIEWSFLGNTLTPLPGFSADTNLVFAPHSYCGSIAITPKVSTCFSDAARHAAAYGVTFWTGEWGWYGDPRSFAAKIRSFARQADAHLVGGAMWQFKQACGDPHSIQTPGGKPPVQLIALRKTGCPGNVDLGWVQPTARIMSRPYPRAAPGRLTGITSDPQAATLTVTGKTDRPGLADIWVPQHGHTPAVGGDNINSVKIETTAGGYRIHASVHGRYRITVK